MTFKLYSGSAEGYQVKNLDDSFRKINVHHYLSISRNNKCLFCTDYTTQIKNNAFGAER